MIIKSLLDTDLYKITMAQAVFHQFPQKTVRYKFTCRTKGVNLAKYRDEINEEIKHLCSLKFSRNELDYLRSLNLFKEDFLSFLAGLRLKFTQIDVYIQAGSFEIMIEGPWVEAILFEVYVLSIVNEVYFRNEYPGLSLEEGKRRLRNKIELVKKANEQCKKAGLPLFQFCDFGTRRRFSSEWQGYVDAELAKELFENFVGTSSVYWAMKNNIKPIGTFAHEYLMAFQAIVPVMESQKAAFESWYEEYRGRLGIALSDIFGIDKFLEDWNYEIATKFDGARQDSGDPFVWGERFIEKNRMLGVDPRTKTGVFSDNLTMEKALGLFSRFVLRMKTFFGIGTHLTNDMGVPALNIVIKMTHYDGKPVCKVSDEPGKAMCEDKDFLRMVTSMLNLDKPKTELKTAV